MRSDREFAQEALRRAVVMRARRKRVRSRTAAVCALAACVTLCAFALWPSPPLMEGQTFAAAHAAPALLVKGAGGYVLCGVVCFALGVALALACLRRRARAAPYRRAGVPPKEG